MRTLLLLVLIGGCSSPANAKILCALGDSVTAGYRAPGETVALPPPAALESLLRRAARGHPWRFARVRNFGVSASWTGEWLSQPPSAMICDNPWLLALPHVRYACDRATPLLEGVFSTHPRCDGWVILLGLNDWLGSITVDQSVDNLAALAAQLPGSVWIGAPSHVTNAAIDYRRALLRNALYARGLLTGIDPPLLPLLPDGIHPDDAGAAALGGLWFGVLCDVNPR